MTDYLYCVNCIMLVDCKYKSINCPCVKCLLKSICVLSCENFSTFLRRKRYTEEFEKKMNRS